jgi:hypothetical protein
MRPGVTRSNTDTRVFQGITKSYRAITNGQSGLGSPRDRILDRADERLPGCGQAVDLIPPGVDERKRFAAIDSGSQCGKREHRVDREASRLREAVGGCDSDSEAREATWSDPDSDRVEVGEAETAFAHHLRDRGHQLARMTRALEQSLNGWLELERLVIRAQKTDRGRRRRGVEAQDVHSTLILRASPPA